MECRFNSARCWWLATASAAVAYSLAVWPTAGEIGGRPFALILGLLPAYLVLSNYAVLRLVSWIDSRRSSFGKLAGLIASMALLLAVSWAVFGRYFHLSTVQGYISQGHLAADFFIRRALQVQQSIVILAALLGVRKGGAGDLVAALLVAGVLGIFVWG
ncbi:hypothetical protein FKV24_010885 [Lysobacter maris]|uniref:Uncharacterized protein n=1 Tax=Marilutibacter maris TaxID=1605891 RepID=A0A508AZN2_9GAMM|nr:hypothetical protein [Lysobacter maris]KAB8184789.1 hypothetical protein FKV24_010885 [Lysobacter maris]